MVSDNSERNRAGAGSSRGFHEIPGIPRPQRRMYEKSLFKSHVPLKYEPENS